MSSTNTLISSITIYGGLTIFICGILGNLLNIRILWRTRHNPCAFIFLASSLVNCAVLFYGLFTRILSVGFQLDWPNTNRMWCKTRAAFSQSSFLISLTCMCLASINRFLSSCRQEKYRRLGRLSFAIWAVILTIIFWFLYYIPYLAYAEILRNPITGLISCSLIKNDTFNNYQIYFLFPIFYGLLPSTILIITGIMTYRNTNKLQISRQRQLISMMLIQIPIVLLSALPHIIFTEYTTFTATMVKSTRQRSAELLMINIILLTCYMTFACPFFIVLDSSKSFREETSMLCLCRKPTLLKNNQIESFFTSAMKNIQIPSYSTNVIEKI